MVMGMREKLIELLKSADDLPVVETYESFADFLIEDGVTIQKWIPVTERLPQNYTYILVTTDGAVIPAYWHNDRMLAFTAIGVTTVGGVTHWMPLPEPQSGERRTDGCSKRD